MCSTVIFDVCLLTCLTGFISLACGDFFDSLLAKGLGLASEARFCLMEGLAAEILARSVFSDFKVSSGLRIILSFARASRAAFLSAIDLTNGSR